MSNETILVVEDEKIIALDLQRRLERTGYNVLGMASNGDEAIGLAETLKPDLVLMDIRLSGRMDGIDAALVIKKRFGYPIIFLTAYTDEKTLERAKEVEPAGYILKPFKQRELYTTIDIALYKNEIERRLQKQERLFSAILHSINDAIIATDVNLSIQFMNPIAERILGLNEAAVQGLALSQVLSLYDPKAGKDLLAGGVPLIDEHPLAFTDVMIKNDKGQAIVVDGTMARIHEKENSTDGFVVAFRDMTEIKRLSDTISYQASHDNLTGLSNREEFSYKLGEILKVLKVSNSENSLVMLDIDRFKAINDTCGALAGDELLRQVASQVLSNIQRNDIAARVGGDEFALILFNCGPADASSVARRLCESVQNREFVWQNVIFPISLSIGIVPIDRGSGDIHSVLAAADDACHISKEEGGNKINVFHPDDTKFQQRRGEMEWIGKLNRAAQEDRFILYYQPIVPLDELKGLKPKLEVLIRLVNEDGSIARPMDFIPAAERYNLMPLIDRWVMRNSIRSFRELLDAGSPLAQCMFSINLSGPSLLDDTLVDAILLELEKYSLSAESFCFEVTETAAIQNLSWASRFIGRLKDHGFTFALDDFGSGFSSFGYLKNLPVDFLKIDGSFVQCVDESLVSYTMVESINSVGHVMGLKTIGEFVKSDEIRKRLVEIGVDYGQGYVFAEPKPLIPN